MVFQPRRLCKEATPRPEGARVSSEPVVAPSGQISRRVWPKRVAGNLPADSKGNLVTPHPPHDLIVGIHLVVLRRPDENVGFFQAGTRAESPADETQTPQRDCSFVGKGSRAVECPESECAWVRKHSGGRPGQVFVQLTARTSGDRPARRLPREAARDRNTSPGPASPCPTPTTSLPRLPRQGIMRVSRRTFPDYSRAGCRIPQGSAATGADGIEVRQVQCRARQVDVTVPGRNLTITIGKIAVSSAHQ